MTCASCGATNVAGQKFCGECGSPLSRVCPSCGTPNPPSQKFCGECGTPMAAGTVAAPRSAAAAATPSSVDVRPGTAPQGGAPGRDGDGPVAERRLVTVLFADLVGFTPFAEERDAEDVRDTLSRYFELASELIGRYGGTVEKFIGDAVMAVWGTPVAREDDAERAVRAALELVDAVRSLGPAIQARAAALTGEAAVTLGAANQGMVAGDLVNTAARLQGVAQPGTVLVGESTQRLASGSIIFVEAGEHTLKGKAAPVPAWQALRVVAERGGRGRADQLEAPFVGRDEELRLLKDLYHATARDKRSRLVSVTGIGGIGKSRLAWEFEKYLDGIVGTAWWHHGRSPAYGEGITFWALGEMIRQRAGLAETDDEATTRAGLRAMLERFVDDERERRWFEQAFLGLLGIEAGAAPEELFGAWRTFFERLSRDGTVVLVFEDLHWADSGTLDFIDHLLEWSRNVPLYILTLARPELLDRRPSWGGGGRSFTSLHLEPMPDSTMRELLLALAPGLPGGAVQAIVARAEGIPLYAIETVRMLVADGRLAPRGDGTYEPTGDVTAVAVPETLTALIAARLDGLAATDRALTLDAAVLGQSFTTAGLAAVSGVDEATIETRLAPLVRSELFVRRGDPRSPERGQYAFVQALIREVAYNTLSRKDRKARHLAAARFFESLGTEEIAGALAGHYLAAHALATEGDEQAALATQARIALRGAADRAIALGAHDQAVTLFTQAAAVAGGPAEEAELLERAGESAFFAARHEDAEGFLRRAVEMHRSRHDLVALARAATRLGRVLLGTYRTETAMELLTAARAEVGSLGVTPDTIAMDTMLARAHWLKDEPDLALEITDRVLPIAERLDLVEVVAEAMTLRGGALGDLGRTYEGIPMLEAGVRLAERHGLSNLALRGRNSLAGYLVGRDPAAALPIMEAGIAEAKRIGDRAAVIRLTANANGALQDLGQWDRADREMDELLAGPLGNFDRAFCISNRTATRALRGEPTADLIRELEALLADEADPNVLNVLSGTRAVEDLAHGDYEAARAHAIEAATLSPFNAPSALGLAGHAGIWARDRDAVAEVFALLARTAAHGGVIDLRKQALLAAIAGFEGRVDESTAGFRSALDGLRGLGSRLEHALTAMDLLASLGPEQRDDPNVVEGRAMLAAAGARPLLAKLDELADAAQAPARRSARPASESSVTLSSDAG